MSGTYAKFSELESERTTQDKPRQHYGMVAVVEIRKNYFSDVTFNYFYFDFRKVLGIKTNVLTPVYSTPYDQRTADVYNARLSCGIKCSALYRWGKPETKISYHR